MVSEGMINWRCGDAKALADLVGKVARHGAARTSGLVILQYLRLTQDGDRLTIEATDLGHAVRAVAVGAGDGQARVCVGASDLALLTAKLSDGGQMVLRQQGMRLTVECGGSRATLPVMDDSDFPALTWDGDPDTAVTLDGRVLTALLSTAAACAATDDNRPALNGVRLVSDEGGALMAESADGFRLMRVTLPADAAHGIAAGLLAAGLILELSSVRTALALVGQGQVRLSRLAGQRLVLSDAGGAWDVAIGLVDALFPDLDRIASQGDGRSLTLTVDPVTTRRALALTTATAAASGISGVVLSVSSQDGTTLEVDPAVAARLGAPDARAQLRGLLGTGFSGEARVGLNGKLLAGIVDALASGGADDLTIRLDAAQPSHPIEVGATLFVGDCELAAQSILMPMMATTA